MSTSSVTSSSSSDLATPLPLIPLLQYEKLGVKRAIIGEEKVVRFQINNTNKENVPLLNFQLSLNTVVSSQKKLKKSFVFHDKKMIEIALGESQLSLDEFHKKYGESQFSIMKATAMKISEIRLSGQKIGMGGFKKVGIKGWKCAVQFNEKSKIVKLVIGQFRAEGTYTKVYLTLTDQAILVPKKIESSDTQIFRAYNNITSLHVFYEKMEDFAKETHDVFQDFNYSKEEFVNLLPSKCEKLQTETRPILVALQAICVSDEFRLEPRSLNDVISRIETLRDVALGVALMHAAGLVHGDLKPDNMLKGRDGKARPHDVGGGEFFYAVDNMEQASNKLNNLTRTAKYNHYEDVYRLERENMKDATDYLLLGRAGDVFALGVSTIEALGGMKDAEGKNKLPFNPKSYFKYNERFYVRDSTTRLKFSCVAQISTQINERLQQLLDSALNSNYTKRPLADEYACALNVISMEIKKKFSISS
jgi:hypothetical protein